MHPKLIGCTNCFADLKLAERGWKIIRNGMHFPIGKLVTIHGDQIGGAYDAGVMPARKATEVCQALQGHTHSAQSFSQVSPADQKNKQMGFVSPLLGTTNAHFMRNRPNAWTHGFTLVDVREDGNFNCYLVTVCDGQFSIGGEVYGNRTRPIAA